VNNCFLSDTRGLVDVKGKGLMRLYLLRRELHRHSRGSAGAGERCSTPRAKVSPVVSRQPFADIGVARTLVPPPSVAVMPEGGDPWDGRLGQGQAAAASGADTATPGPPPTAQQVPRRGSVLPAASTGDSPAVGDGEEGFNTPEPVVKGRRRRGTGGARSSKVGPVSTPSQGVDAEERPRGGPQPHRHRLSDEVEDMVEDVVVVEDGAGLGEDQDEEEEGQEGQGRGRAGGDSGAASLSPTGTLFKTLLEPGKWTRPVNNDDLLAALFDTDTVEQGAGASNGSSAPASRASSGSPSRSLRTGLGSDRGSPSDSPNTRRASSARVVVGAPRGGILSPLYRTLPTALSARGMSARLGRLFQSSPAVDGSNSDSDSRAEAALDDLVRVSSTTGSPGKQSPLMRMLSHAHSLGSEAIRKVRVCRGGVHPFPLLQCGFLPCPPPHPPSPHPGTTTTTTTPRRSHPPMQRSPPPPPCGPSLAVPACTRKGSHVQPTCCHPLTPQPPPPPQPIPHPSLTHS
jgi:hypothetical protein